jgi:hypothetical protein
MIQFTMAIDLANRWVQSIFAAAVTVYALMRGGPRVRSVAIVNAIGWSVGSVASLLIKPVGPHLIVTWVSQTLLAVGLLYFTLKYDSAFLGLAVTGQALQFALDASVIGRFHGAPFLQQFTIGVVLNALSYLTLIGVLGFAISERRRESFPGPMRILRPG